MSTRLDQPLRKSPSPSSWWLGLSPEQFSEKAKQEAARMAASDREFLRYEPTARGPRTPAKGA